MNLTNRFNTKMYTRVVATIERSAGNEQVGDMWTETKSFPLDSPLEDVMVWAQDKCSGRLMLTMDEGSPADPDKMPF